VITEEEEERIVQKIIDRLSAMNHPFKRNKEIKERDNFLRYLYMAISANLYNGSPGRDYKNTARGAYEAANAHWEEWCKRE
jgi:hypothetical protein